MVVRGKSGGNCYRKIEADLRALTLYVGISPLSVFLFAFGSYWLFGYSLLANSISIGVGVAVSLFIQRKLNGQLLRKGLSVVLPKKYQLTNK